MNNFKVVGGSWDGRVLTASHTEVFANERYVIRHYRFEQGSIRIWALDSLTEYDVFKRLVDNYGS